LEFQQLRGFFLFSEFNITDAELSDLVNKLRIDDVNKARKGQVTVDYQRFASFKPEDDNAKNKFFKYVDPQLLKKPTYQKFIALNDNYERDTGIRENDTPQEKKEVSEFLDAVTATKVWNSLYNFLHRNKHPYATNKKNLYKWVQQLWFTKYSRKGGVPDTSGFEHVFIGEIKNNEIFGLHNWLRFYLLENDPKEDFNYRGFVIKRFNVMAALRYSWKKEFKRTGSFLIGTSPEFDLALYTLCFLSRPVPQTCNFEIDGCQVQISSFHLYQNQKPFIGSIYPTAGKMTALCAAKKS
uniref:Endoribonuclease n=1 Tax=Syphacia muris TaxID=451379 RepID=A0A0N5AYH5_9BILA